MFFGRRRLNRFDDPEGRYGVLYLARQREGAFVERFLRDPGAYQRVISEAELEGTLLSSVSTTRALRLVDLAGRGLARMGADGRLATGNYTLAQRWSRACYHHPAEPDGLRYRSRHNPRFLCAAIFDRAEGALSTETSATLREHLGSTALFELLERYQVALV